LEFFNERYLMLEFFFERYSKMLSWAQFHQHSLYEFFVQTSFRQLFSSYMYVEKAVKTTFVQKRRKFNVDEIDTCRGQPFLFDLSPNLSNVQSLFVFKIIFQSYVIFLRVVLSNWNVGAFDAGLLLYWSWHLVLNFVLQTINRWANQRKCQILQYTSEH